MKIFVSMLLAGLTQLSLAGSIDFKEGTSSFLKQQVDEVVAMLPASYLDSTKGKVTFEAKDIKDSLMTNDLCSMGEGSLFAVTLKKKGNHVISISSKLAQLAQSNKIEFKCSHGNFKRFLQAAIAHELTHVKDNAEHISTEDDFQRIVGVRHIKRSGKTKVLNQNISSSPDAYEFKNLEESLAVNTEYLLLDPQFECRKPATANYLSKRLGIPLKNICLKNYKVMTQSAYLEDNYLHTVSIDPKRVYQIHYLFAGQGKALMSRWGHAMFRLVICAPHRKSVGPDCLEDVSHHVALSYRAYMNDMSINYMKGVFGAYPTQLFIFRYHEMQQEYTKFELRDLFSVPLKLSSAQKEEFINVTLERYWSFQGKYYFLDNNCSTETKKHLAIALNDEQSKLIHSITPRKIYRDLIAKRNGLTEEIVDGLSREQMMEKGFMVPTIYPYLEKRFSELKRAGIYREKNFADFLKLSNSKARLIAYESFFQGDVEIDLKKTLILKVIYIERYLATRFMLELPKKAFALVKKNKDVEGEVMKMGGALKSLFLQPWEVVEASYGVPSVHEMDTLYPQFLNKRKEDLKVSSEVQMQNLAGLLKNPAFNKELMEVDEMKRIKTLTNQIFQETNL